jgi:uncharacterized protein YtpQ (UPF0354 family)
MRFLFFFVALGLFAGPAAADNLSPRAFADAGATAAATALPTARVMVTGNLQLQINYGDGSGSATLSLSNAYDLYLHHPEHLKEVISTYVAAIPPPAPTAKANGIDRSRIVPVVKNRQRFDHVQRLYGAEGKGLQYSEGPFTSELVVVYAEDNSTAMRFLSTADDIGDRGQLNDLAVANLIQLLPKIEMRAGADKTWLISAGGDYESSLLLLSDLWSSGQIKVDGEIVVAVPAKDALLVTGTRNAAGVARLRKFAAEVASGAYGLTKVLFIYRDGKFATFELNNR